eukprot:CAMPEP_0206142774 /NCGR_PEP_ID=MMETSP1473-20131121/18136_1 /ASSEMBLY_ACC=CAM_ASM_001109 /TAXON_ID=1461547 /ORGANISM="Stichococcus sp, Strain RCC1054" /LENGTH=1052 /DNA_ID=CAMNT_0053537897 /DNA_START=385 /DNA_END=3544 /DNA_ORIENTATION=+
MRGANRCTSEAALVATAACGAAAGGFDSLSPTGSGQGSRPGGLVDLDTVENRPIEESDQPEELPPDIVYSLGFRMEDLVQEPLSLRAKEPGVTITSTTNGSTSVGGNRTFGGGAYLTLGANEQLTAETADKAADDAALASAPQYFVDPHAEENDTAAVTAEGGAEGLKADAAAWKYWEQPSDGSEFLCPFNTSGPAEVVAWGGNNLQRSARDCAASCMVERKCNAWFWCKDSGKADCLDQQSGTWVPWHGCKLLALPVLPAPPLDPATRVDTSEASLFRSFAVGYIKRELYARPPQVIVATAVQLCARGDWTEPEHHWANHMSWVSVWNKVDYARLHGTTFHFTALKDFKTTKVDLVLSLLEEEEGNSEAPWVLWVDVRAMVANPAFAFPTVKAYDAVGAELVLFGSREGVLSGDSWKHDTGVLMVKNTPWARQFFRDARAVLRKPSLMNDAITRDNHLHGVRNITLEQVIMSLLVREDGKHLPKVHFERSFCLACFWRGHNLRAPTSYITHFSAVPSCGHFGLQKDPGYEESFMQNSNISRCNFMKALHRSAPLETAALPPPFRTDYTALMEWVMVEGRKHLKHSAAACRTACAVSPRCTAWVWCARAGGCDDGKALVPKVWPMGACALLDAPPWAPLQEGSRGPLFSSFSMGFMQDYRDPQRERQTMLGGEQVDASSGRSRRARTRRRGAKGSKGGEGGGDGGTPSLGLLGASPAEALALRRAAAKQAAAAAASRWTVGRWLLPWGRMHGVSRVRRVPPLDKPNVAIISAVPPNPCSFPIADHFNALGVANKQDYARRHGWEVHLSAENVDPTAIGNFNKMAFIKKMLNDTPRADAEWIWWTDADTLITDMAFEFPFHRYAEYDLVVWGQKERIQDGDLEGINCGVMMFRNSAWSRAFLAELSEYAHLGEDALLEMRPVLEKEVYPLVKGFKDTPFIVYMLKTRPYAATGEGYIERVYFEQEVGFNRHWLQVDWASGENPLLTHYAGCTVCNPPEGKLSEEVIRGCNSEYAKAYAFGRCNLAAAYTNRTAPAVCSYPASDISHLSIRLGS